MILKRFYDEKLAQASYLVGCAAAGEALVVDPNRDVEQYVRAADAEGLRITHVTETHIHADFVSGSRELARSTGARLHLSGEGGAEWSYRYAADEGARLLRHGDRVEVGSIRIEAVHTPGHTPEHLTFLVTDGAATDAPIGALTGDFIFVGDVGRPDLLERAAGVRGTMRSAAADLFRSLRAFRSAHLEWLQLWPGHGAGSACGKGIGSIPQTTLGYELRTSWPFAHADEASFVDAVLAGQPEPPKYFAEMKRINRDGPPLLGRPVRPPRLAAAHVAALLDAGAMVVDTRAPDDFAASHLRGTLNIPLDRSFPTWAGWLVPYDRDFYLVGDDAAVGEAVRDLATVGLDRVAGSIGAQVIAAMEEVPGRVGTIAQVDGDGVASRLGQPGFTLLDVRSGAEWEEGRIPGALHIPLGDVPARMAEIPTEGTVAVHCESGGRSPIAASLIAAAGVDTVLDFRGGLAQWRDEGREIQTGAPARRAAA